MSENQTMSIETEVAYTIYYLIMLFISTIILNGMISVVMNSACPPDQYRQRLYNERRNMRREDKYLKPKRSRTPPRKTIGRKRSKSYHEREFMIGK